MINQQIYIINGRPHVRVIQQPFYPNNPYQSRNVYMNHPPPQNQYMPARQQHINAIDGIPITEQYEPERGDPIVVQQAIYKAEVVVRGNKDKEVINQEEAIITSEGYASEDGKIWKHLPKIMMTVFKLGKLAIQTVTKVKAKFDNSLPNHKIMKMTSNNAEFYLGFKDTVFDEWFLRLVWAKLMLQRRECQDFGNWEREIKGKIFKKSQILGEWELRTVAIDAYHGLQSFKDNSHSASLQIKHTKQIWTRFQEIKGGYFLVIKLWYGIIKTQFAVPTAHCLSWLYHFLTLLSTL